MSGQLRFSVFQLFVLCFAELLLKLNNPLAVMPAFAIIVMLCSEGWRRDFLFRAA